MNAVREEVQEQEGNEDYKQRKAQRLREEEKAEIKRQEYFEKRKPYENLGRIINQTDDQGSYVHSYHKRAFARAKLKSLRFFLNEQDKDKKEIEQSCKLMLYGPGENNWDHLDVLVSAIASTALFTAVAVSAYEVYNLF